jgi:hypothetical protein
MKMANMKLNKLLIVFIAFLSLHRAFSQQSRDHNIDVSYIDSMIRHEKYFSDNNKISAPEGTKWFRFLPGESGRIMFLAPHATSQTREGSIKAADAGTGSLIEVLNILRNVPVFYTTYQSPSDPNYYDDNEFKDSLNVLLSTVGPEFVIDLHASDESRPYDVDFGTMHGSSLLDKSGWLDTLKRELYNEGIINLSSNFFGAEKNETDTKFVSNHGFACLQLEINADYLSPARGRAYAKRTLHMLRALIRFIDDIQR